MSWQVRTPAASEVVGARAIGFKLRPSTIKARGMCMCMCMWHVACACGTCACGMCMWHVHVWHVHVACGFAQTGAHARITTCAAACYSSTMHSRAGTRHNMGAQPDTRTRRRLALLPMGGGVSRWQRAPCPAVLSTVLSTVLSAVVLQAVLSAEALQAVCRLESDAPRSCACRWPRHVRRRRVCARVAD